jgi:hypothetical protein
MALKGSSHSNNQSNISTMNQIVDALLRLNATLRRIAALLEKLYGEEDNK